MNSNYSTQQQPFRRRVFTRTEQTPFILANKEYQLSNNIYARQYTTMSKTSNGSANSARQIKSQSKSRVRSVSSKSLFSSAKVNSNRNVQYKPLLKSNKFVPIAKNQLMINQDHESVQKKLKEVLNQKLNRKILKIKQQIRHTEGVRKFVDDTLQKYNTRTNEDVSTNLKLRKQNLQHSYNAEKFNSLISKHMEYDPLQFSRQQKIKSVVKVDASTSMQKLENDEKKNQVHKKSIGIQANLNDIQVKSNSTKQKVNNDSKIKEQKPYFRQKQHQQKQYNEIKFYSKQKDQQKISFDRKSDFQSSEKSLQISNKSKKQQQIKKQHIKQSKLQSKKEQKFSSPQANIKQKTKKQQTIKQQNKNSKVNFNDKQQFNLDQIEDITLTPQSKYHNKQQQQIINNGNKKQPKKQLKIKQVKDSKMINQQPSQQKPRQSNAEQTAKNAKQLATPPALKRQETNQSKQSSKRKDDSQDNKKKLRQIAEKQLEQANRIIDIMTPVGEVAGYCSQSLKKSKLNWFTPAILLYKQCYEKFKQYEYVYAKAAELGIIKEAEKDNYIQENGTILKNLQKVIGMAKKKNKLSAEHQKLVTSTQPVHLATIIQKQVLVFAKEVSQSEQQQNFDVLMCLLRMINSVKILAHLKGLKIQPIAKLQQVDQQQIPDLIRANLELIQQKKLKL